jgi:DNA invertase Pin-like site-specific DNA recombinase
LAAVAEEQRRTISENTKSALQAAKRRGKILGNYGKKLSQKNKRHADSFAESIYPIIQNIQDVGITSFREIKDELNKRNVRTRTGGRWHKTSVYNIMKRFDKLFKNMAA